MRLFDRILSRKITSEQATTAFKNFAVACIAGFRKENELFDKAFPENNAFESALKIIDKEFKRLDSKSNRNEQINLFKSIYLKIKKEQKLAHLIGTKVDENIALFVVIQIDENAKKNVISAFEKDGEVALELYKNSYRADYLRRWLLYIIIEAGLILTFEDFFGSKIENAIIQRYEIMIEDHISKLIAEVLISYDASIWATFNVKNTDYQFTAAYKRSQAMSLFLTGVELNDYEIMDKGTTDYVEAMKINYN
jgi:hypothetical protein